MEQITTLRVALLIYSVVISLLLAFWVYKNNPKSATNLTFSILSLLTAVWLIIMHLSFSPTLMSLFWIRLTLFLAVPQATTFFLLAHTIPNTRLQFNKRVFYIIFFVAAIVMALTMSRYVFTGIKIIGNTPQPIPGYGMPIFAIFVMVIACAR